MSSPKSHTDKTSAADKSIGFDYQYYYFLHKALNLKVNQSVGLECKDDVHTELDQSANIFYQLKHTTQLTADGTPPALTRLDRDLWMTLYNWAMVITDEVAGRKDINKQLDFTRRSEFHLVANKTKSPSNSVLEVIENLQIHKIEIKDVIAELEDAKKAAVDQKIKEYIDKVIKVDKAVLENYFRQIRFELEVDGILDMVRQAIHEFHVDKSKVQSVLEGIDSNLREHVYKTVKSGAPVILTFAEFHAKARKHIQDARSTKLSTMAVKPPLPSDLFAQTFIKRLIEIKAISIDEKEYAAELTATMLQLTSHIEHWEISGEITSKDISDFHDAVNLQWKNKFRLEYVDCPDEKIERIGRAILKEMLDSNFKLSEDVLSLQHSNGEVHHLSDTGKIGWHKHWKTK